MPEVTREEVRSLLVHGLRGGNATRRLPVQVARARLFHRLQDEEAEIRRVHSPGSHRGWRGQRQGHRVTEAPLGHFNPRDISPPFRPLPILSARSAPSAVTQSCWAGTGWVLGTQ